MSACLSTCPHACTPVCLASIESAPQTTAKRPGKPMRRLDMLCDCVGVTDYLALMQTLTQVYSAASKPKMPMAIRSFWSDWRVSNQMMQAKQNEKRRMPRKMKSVWWSKSHFAARWIYPQISRMVILVEYMELKSHPIWNDIQHA